MSCSQCQKGKIVSECGLCQSSLCKNCRQTLNPKDFSLLEKIPVEYTHAAYCGACFDQKVNPALLEYQQFETQAQNIYFQSNKYRGNPHVINKYTKTISIAKCDDRRQLILMLAYQAAKLNYNAIIAADIRSKRIYADGGYGHYEWSGSAIPANINGALFEASTIF